MRTILFTIFLLLLSASISAQSIDVTMRKQQIDDAKQTEYREKIGLDYTMPDYNVKKIDAKKIGHRLAGILLYLEENYKQAIYNRKLAAIIAEQKEAFVNSYFELTKLKLVSISKTDNVIVVKYKVTIDTKADKKEQTDLQFCFTDGISDSQKVNELFAYMSRYVSAREELE